MAKKRSTVYLIIIALAAALAGALLARHAGQAPVALQSGTLLPGGRPVPDFTLTDQEGEPFGMARLKGQPSLLFFGFTHCPDVCPTTLALLAGLERKPPIPGLRTLFVTVDPERDDTLTLKRYVNAFSGQMIGLRGGDAQLDMLMHSLGAVRYKHPLPGGDYTMDHSATLYLIDARGRLAAVFTPPFSLPALDADLRQAGRVLER